ncbi:MAG TPA: hypothetical protein PLG77_01685 [Burkholderiaceae bacterium]|nr:hypothetical protein [Burkholderiaceae bacterium]HRP27127.1 hypothetical protein [Burkholderiaceae bacterium]
MSALHGEGAHGPLLRLFGTPAGEVFVCRCGVVTLTMQHLSLRLQPQAFRELTQLLAHAQSRLDRCSAPAPDEPDAGRDPLQARRHMH